MVLTTTAEGGVLVQGHGRRIAILDAHPPGHRLCRSAGVSPHARAHIVPRHVLKRILRYIKGTTTHGLHLHTHKTPTLTAYTDADWASCPDTWRLTSRFKIVTEPLKLLPHYRLNPSSRSLSNNTEVTRRLWVVHGKSLTSQDRHLYNKLTRRRVQRQTNHKLLHNILQRFIITNQVFCITVNISEFETQRD
jgi:hypothetical protein